MADRNRGLQVFDSNGRFLAKWEDCGEEHPLDSTSGVAVDAQGNVYVSDFMHGRICKFDSTGTYVGAWDGEGSPDGALGLIGQIALDSQDNLYVTEPLAGRVRKFRQQVLNVP